MLVLEQKDENPTIFLLIKVDSLLYMLVSCFGPNTLFNSQSGVASSNALIRPWSDI